MTRSLMVVLALCVAASTPASAQDAAARAAATADAFFRARADERWRGAARLLDLESLGDARDQRVRFARRAPQRSEAVTPQLFLDMDPAMPRAVAEYQAKKVNERMRVPTDPFEYEFARVPSVDSLAALPLEELGARWVEAHDLRWTVRLAHERNHDPNCGDAVRRQTAAIDSLASGPPRVIGVVVDSTLAYVLYDAFAPWDFPPAVERRNTVRGDSSSVARRARRASRVPSPSVLVLREIGGQWRVDPTRITEPGMAFGFSCTSVTRPVSPDDTASVRRTPP